MYFCTYLQNNKKNPITTKKISRVVLNRLKMKIMELI